MEPKSRLQVVGQEIDESSAPQEPRINKIAGDVVLLALSTLSQKAVVSLAALFTLATVASAFILWYVTPEPNVYQLIKLGLYGLFVLGANWIVRRH